MLLDDADYEFISRWKWYRHAKGYAARNAPRNGNPIRKTIYMHKVILDVESEVDHEDRNKLNNQRINLRPCTKSQNQMNSLKRSGTTSRFKGTSWHKGMGKWQAQIQQNGKNRFLGYFDDEFQAALAYNREAKIVFGEFANLNP